ncbi:CzcE family metal-binding protein [uncultured Oxalicibacterium sp.]|uniref:CzcE family metal-binding protein n=1 Tax=uncultured Oxalicibacterium sp. TaxID=1168540 RepID=UPI0025D670CF|nr:CzcE family metal-binding protein [uncultured Oxalicibacterium sp.]
MRLAFLPAALLITATLALATGCASPPRVELYGNPAPSAAAQRSIVITPETRWVNVEGGEIVNFIVGDKMFAWDFYVGTTISHFDLNEVAPAGILDHRVTAYVSPDPRYRGSGLE